MTSRKNGLKKHLLKLWLAATLIFFATTLVGAGTTQAADPELTVYVYERWTNDPIADATVKIHEYYSPYDLVSKKNTLPNGTAKFSVDPNKMYYILVSHGEYDDDYTSVYVGVDPASRDVYLDRVWYTGSVVAKAWTDEPSLNPGDKSTLKISIYNENETYSITLMNISIKFPWYGFYEDHWIGNETILDDETVEVEANSSWTYSLPFDVPADSRAYGSGGGVVFNTTAKAWKEVVTMTIDGPKIALEPELTTVKTQFTATPKIQLSWPMHDKSVSASLFIVQILLIIVIVCLAASVALNLRGSRRLGQ